MKTNNSTQNTRKKTKEKATETLTKTRGDLINKCSNKSKCITNVKRVFEFIDFLVSNKNAAQRKGRTENKKRQTNESVVTRGQTTIIDRNIQIEGKYNVKYFIGMSNFLAITLIHIHMHKTSFNLYIFCTK